MKTIFNFLQIANWLYFCKKNLEQIKTLLNNDNKEEIIKKLQQEKNKLIILKSVLLRERNIHGISPIFLKNLKQIKKEYGILE